MVDPGATVKMKLIPVNGVGVGVGVGVAVGVGVVPGTGVGVAVGVGVTLGLVLETIRLGDITQPASKLASIHTKKPDPDFMLTTERRAAEGDA
jgi:hypothetical protein